MAYARDDVVSAIRSILFPKTYISREQQSLCVESKKTVNLKVPPLLPIYLTLLLWNISSTVSVNGPVMPLYIRSLRIEVIGWSVLAMSLAAGEFVFEWVWGTLSDRLDRRIFMVASMLSMGALFPLYTLKSLIPYFFILQFLSGALTVTMGPITRALVSDHAPASSIGMSMGLLFSFNALGRMVGPLLGSYVAQVWSFEESFYVSSLFLLIGATAVSIALRRNHGGRTPTEDRPMLGILGGIRTLISMPPVPMLFLLGILTFIGISSVTAFLPIYASEQIGMSTMEVGTLLAAASAAQLAAPLLGSLSDRIGRSVLISAGLILSSLVFLCYLLVQTPFQLLLVSIAISICFSANSMLPAMLSDIAPRRLRGTAMGIYGSFEDLGLVVGPLLYGLVWSRYAPACIFVVASATQVLGIAPLLLIRSKKPRNGG